MRFRDYLNENQKEQVSNIKYMIRDKNTGKFYVKGTDFTNIMFNKSGKIFPDLKKLTNQLNWFKRSILTVDSRHFTTEEKVEGYTKPQIDLLNSLEIVEMKVVEDVIPSPLISEIIKYLKDFKLKDVKPN